MLTLAAAPSAQKANVPLISPASTNPKVTTVGDYIFRACFTDPFQGAAMAKFAQNSLGARTAAILIDSNSDYSNNLAQMFEAKFTQLGGQIVIKQRYQQGDRDFTAQLKSIQTSHPDVIFLPGYYGEAAAIGRQAKQIGLNQPLLGGDGWDSPQLFDLGGTALNGSFITNHFAVDNSTPEVQKFVVAYRARYDTTPDAIAALAYDAMYLLADSLKRAGSSEGQKLRDAIAGTKNFHAVTGDITIDSDRNSLKPVVILQVQNGKFVYKESVQPN
jgi:branched-chain amino acid transport system substrate-binding protein